MTTLTLAQNTNLSIFQKVKKTLNTFWMITKLMIVVAIAAFFFHLNDAYSQKVEDYEDLYLSVEQLIKDYNKESDIIKNELNQVKGELEKLKLENQRLEFEKANLVSNNTYLKGKFGNALIQQETVADAAKTHIVEPVKSSINIAVSGVKSLFK